MKWFEKRVVAARNAGYFHPQGRHVYSPVCMYTAGLYEPHQDLKSTLGQVARVGLTTNNHSTLY